MIAHGYRSHLDRRYVSADQRLDFRIGETSGLFPNIYNNYSVDDPWKCKHLSGNANQFSGNFGNDLGNLQGIWEHHHQQ